MPATIHRPYKDAYSQDYAAFGGGRCLCGGGSLLLRRPLCLLGENLRFDDCSEIQVDGKDLPVTPILCNTPMRVPLDDCQRRGILGGLPDSNGPGDRQIRSSLMTV